MATTSRAIPASSAATVRRAAWSIPATTVPGGDHPSGDGGNPRVPILTHVVPGTHTIVTHTIVVPITPRP